MKEEIINRADQINLLRNAMSNGSIDAANQIKNHVDNKIKLINENFSYNTEQRNKAKIRIYSNIHETARLIDSNYENFNEIGEATIFLEENYFDKNSIKHISPDIRKYKLDEIIEDIIKIENHDPKTTTELKKYVNRTDSMLSYAIYLAAKEENKDALNELKTIIQPKVLSPEFYMMHLAKVAEFTKKIVRYEGPGATLPKLSARRFLETQYFKNQ